MPNGLVHNFQERLAHSQSLNDEGHWISFYRRLWPDMLMAVRIDKDSKLQRWGIDREILLPNGRRFSIDEKNCDRDYGDLLIEEWSVGNYDANGRYCGTKIGWSLDPDKRCDFVAYCIPAAGKCYLLPFEILRQTCLANLSRWKTLSDGGGRSAYPKDSPNERYWTRNCAVMWDELKRSMAQQMHRSFGTITTQLPKPLQNGQQLEFNW